ncbi:MAG: hypothetical protein HXK03_01635 [Schaalia georgiae]|uniref:Uncharacterized protein n=1 Tax=Schaalia georgiae TaxID=52768 RepID=A0A929MY56_9ACTO|nr:hypothetical protein [Schaalia georgiae]
MKTARLVLAALDSSGLVAGIGGIGYAADPAGVESARVAAKAASQGGGSSRADGTGVGYDCDNYDTLVSAGRNAAPRLANTGSPMAVDGGVTGMLLAGGVALVVARKCG